MPLFLMIFSCTQLRIGVFRARNYEESFFRVCFYVAPQTTTNKNRTTNFRDQQIPRLFFGVEHEMLGIV